MSSYLCYLAGPMSGLTFDESNAWRVKFAENVDSSIKVLSPFRGKNYLRGKVIPDTLPEHTQSTQHAILARDMFDVRRADVIVINFFGAKTVSIGTVCEMATAHVLNKPTITCIEKGNPHDHAFIREYARNGYITDDPEELIYLTETLVLPEKEEVAPRDWSTSPVRQNSIPEDRVPVWTYKSPNASWGDVFPDE